MENIQILCSSHWIWTREPSTEGITTKPICCLKRWVIMGKSDRKKGHHWSQWIVHVTLEAHFWRMLGLTQWFRAFSRVMLLSVFIVHCTWLPNHLWCWSFCREGCRFVEAAGQHILNASISLPYILMGLNGGFQFVFKKFSNAITALKWEMNSAVTSHTLHDHTCVQWPLRPAKNERSLLSDWLGTLTLRWHRNGEY